VSEAIPSDTIGVVRLLVVRLQRGTLRRLEITKPDALYWQPDRASNSIGITIWHYTRWCDYFGTVAMVDGSIEDQHWFRDGWLAKTGYDPRGLGLEGLGLLTDYTVDEMLAAPHLSASGLAAYHTASTDSMLAALERDDLASLSRTMRAGGEDASRFAHVFGLMLGAHRHLGEIDALNSLYERQRAA
jgi:hypothetical protein